MIRFITGDCLEEMRKMPARCVDLVLSDPPEPVKDAPYSFLRDALGECLRVSRGPVVFLGVPLQGGRYVHSWEPMEEDRMYWWVPVQGGAVPVPIYAWRGPTAAQGTVLVMPVDRSLCELHDGAKPTALMAALLDLFPGQRVLDPFCGIGSVALACKERGRSFTGIDINAEFIRIAAGRVFPAKEAA